MLLLFRSVLSVCRDNRGRVQQSSLIGNSVNIRLYRLSFFISRVCISTIATYNKCTPRKCSCELDHIRVLLDPVVDIYQGWSTLWLGTLHESRNVYPAKIRLYLQLEVRPIGAGYCTGFVSTLWISVKYIFSWKQHTSANWPCLNKTLLSSLTELSNLCKCLCHS